MYGMYSSLKRSCFFIDYIRLVVVLLISLSLYLSLSPSLFSIPLLSLSLSLCLTGFIFLIHTIYVTSECLMKIASHKSKSPGLYSRKLCKMWSLLFSTDQEFVRYKALLSFSFFAMVRYKNMPSFLSLKVEVRIPG